jgi:hypothetical protein
MAEDELRRLEHEVERKITKAFDNLRSWIPTNLGLNDASSEKKVPGSKSQKTDEFSALYICVRKRVP